MPEQKPRRISLQDALTELRPFMSKATFYGDKKSGNPGPRWTMVDRLKMRHSRNGVTLDRKALERWLKTLEGDPAHNAHPNSARLGDHSRSKGGTKSYGADVAALYRAVEAGAINREQFEQAMDSLAGE